MNIESEKQYILVMVANPYPCAGIVEVSPDGHPRTDRVRKWTRAWGQRGQPLYRGTHLVCTVHDPSSSGGACSIPRRQLSILDPTPRPAHEAWRLASRAARSTHLRFFTAAEIVDSLRAAAHGGA